MTTFLLAPPPHNQPQLTAGSKAVFLTVDATVSALRQAESLVAQCAGTTPSSIWPLEDAVEFQSVAAELRSAAAGAWRLGWLGLLGLLQFWDCLYGAWLIGFKQQPVQCPLLCLHLTAATLPTGPQVWPPLAIACQRMCSVTPSMCTSSFLPSTSRLLSCQVRCGCAVRCLAASL